MSLLTENEFVQQLKNEGYDARKYTLRYWRKQGKLPQLIRISNQYYYSDYELNIVREFLESHGKFRKDFLTTYVLENCVFKIYDIHVYKLSRKFLYIINTDKGVLVEKYDSPHNYF